MKSRFLIVLIFLISTVGSLFAQTIGVIEVGSSGVKARVIEIKRASSAADSQQSPEIIYKELFRREINSNVVDGAVNRALLANKIQETAIAVSSLVAEMKRFDPASLKLVGSTSFDNYTNRSALEDAIEKAVGQRVAFISADDEIFYALRTSVRKQLLPRSILIDIGGGNTKLGYFSQYIPGKNFASVKFEYGTRTLHAKAVKLNPNDVRQATLQIIDNEVRPLLREAVARNAGLSNPTRRVYIEGGTPWAFATYAQPRKSTDSYNYLNRGDIDRVLNLLSSGGLTTAGLSDQQASIVSSVGDVYSQEQYMVGGLLLKAILEELKINNREFAFNRFGGWSIGYAISVYAEENKLDF